MEATIIYPHQLFAAHPGVAKGRPIFLIEDPLFFGTDPRWPLTLHGQKLVLHRASMQAYAAELSAAEQVVRVVEAPEGSHTDSVGVLEALFPAAPSTLHLADPADDVLMRRIRRYAARHGVALRRMEELTDGITAPRAACTTWRALYAGLRTFRQDLMAHIHTENNILFERFAPAAVH